jgi:hypothetical protein
MAGKRLGIKLAEVVPQEIPVPVEITHLLDRGFTEEVAEEVAEYTIIGNLKKHPKYTVQSFVKGGGRITKKSVYKTISGLSDETLEIATKNIYDEVFFQQQAMTIVNDDRPSPFFVPKIYKFNVYENNGDVIALIEMESININPSNKATIEELDMVKQYLIRHGIHHNDLLIPARLTSFSAAASLVDEDKPNFGNLLHDTTGRLWVIDFGSAATVEKGAKGGAMRIKSHRKSHRKSRRKMRKTNRKSRVKK